MDFEKKYPITQRPGKFILVQWTRGYKQVDLYYEDKLIDSVQGGSKLKKGVTLANDAGIIQLKLSEKPIMLDVIVDGYHSPVNNSHPAKELKRSAVFFWMILTFAIVGALLEGMRFGVDGAGKIIVSFNLFVIVGFTVAGIGVSKSKPWAFYLGLSLYSFTTFVALLALFSANILVMLTFVVRIVMLVFLSMNVKHAAGTFRHKRFVKKADEQLLDQ